MRNDGQPRAGWPQERIKVEVTLRRSGDMVGEGMGTWWEKGWCHRGRRDGVMVGEVGDMAGEGLGT